MLSHSQPNHLNLWYVLKTGNAELHFEAKLRIPGDLNVHFVRFRRQCSHFSQLDVFSFSWLKTALTLGELQFYDAVHWRIQNENFIQNSGQVSWLH